MLKNILFFPFVLKIVFPILYVTMFSPIVFPIFSVTMFPPLILTTYYYCSFLLQNELCRMKFDVSMLHELVREYCVYRGIVDNGLASSFGEFPFLQFSIVIF